MTNQDAQDYQARYPALGKVAATLCEHIADRLHGLPHIDRVSCRAKDPGSYQAKASSLLPNGLPKYVAPLIQIQDQIGARVIVFYKEDVKIVADMLERYLRHVERKEHVPDSYWKFGYFGLHWIFALPDDVIPLDVDKDKVPRFFELQVKTLFQHAWSEANHDLAYKARADLTADQERLFAYAAAQAWGADRVFDELNRNLDRGDPNLVCYPGSVCSRDDR